MPLPASEDGRPPRKDPAAPASPRYKNTRSSPRKSRQDLRAQSPLSDAGSEPRQRHVKVVLPEMDRRGGDGRGSASYPSFSKAHSRESVRSTDSGSGKDALTPQATDVSNSRPSSKSPPSRDRAATESRGQAPPSPPLTAVDASDLRRAGSGSSMRQAAEDARATHARRKSADNETLHDLRKAEEGTSGLKTSTSKPSAAAKSSLRSLFQGRSALASGKKTPLTPSKKSRSVVDSDATPLGDNRKRSSRRSDDASDSVESLLRPPKDRVPSRGAPRSSNDGKSAPVIEVFTSFGSDSDVDDIPGPPRSGPSMAPPPPPPPPPAMATEVPRVDYLLQNGGLAHLVQKDFGSAVSSSQPQEYQQYMSPRVGSSRQVDISKTFKPFHNLLDEYSSVLSKSGSLAVATGYKSVARRLLDRLENVFSRNISSELCECVLCKTARTDESVTEEDTGVSWGEVLELVSGRQKLPPWPPFSLSSTAMNGLGISNLEQQAPMQKLDIDVPEEYREHYIRQSKKTKQAVDKWLASQPEDQPAPPQEVDDETLIFAMLTYLEPGQRRTFTALLRGMTAVPDSRAPTPALPTGPRPDLLSRTSLALQRLYRLPRPPRDPECAMFLLNNRNLHSALATLAAISQQEWDILISGRFDGFLWSGAEDGEGQEEKPYGSGAKQASSSSSSLPFQPPSRTATPNGAPKNATAGPVQMDEETEIAVLAEVEREIYLGMEALEDAFELLHSKAETVRSALLKRSAGLSLQARRRGQGDDERPQARLGTPAIGANGGLASLLNGRHGEDDADMFDGRSELAPDDSASNVGWRTREREKRDRYKKRRPGTTRRTERRTPAPVEEEEEEEAELPVRPKR